MSALKRGVPDRKARRIVERAWAKAAAKWLGVRRSRERVGRTDLMIGDLKGIFQKDGKEYVR